MMPFPARRLTPAQAATLLIVVLTAYRISDARAPFRKDEVNVRNAKVAFVIDGDTFETSEGERIRLLGVDAPEAAHHNQPADHYGAAAAAWLTERLLNQTVTLRIGQPATDHYGRTLAWVFLNETTLVNRELLACGMAKLLDRYGLPADLEVPLREASADAQVRRLGIWR